MLIIVNYFVINFSSIIYSLQIYIKLSKFEIFNEGFCQKTVISAVSSTSLSHKLAFFAVRLGYIQRFFVTLRRFLSLNKVKLEKTTYIIVAMLAAILLYSCANIGRPDGGPRDMDPPVFMGSDPKPNALNVTKNKIEITFNEIVTLKDQQTKVVVSPVQKEMPSIRANGRKVTVEFRDTLRPATTYSIDFADAIQDNNEGNPLEDFAIAFSTGDTIDSLAVSGIVLRARDLEPMQKIIVGIHSNADDSAFKTTQFERISRTNSYGQFTIRNLKPGSYRVYALNDLDGNYKFSRNEDLAFLADVVVPSSHPITTMDTIFTQKNIVDTIVEGHHTVFTPNDLFLSMFNEGYRAQYLKANERPEDKKMLIKFAAPADSMPRIKILKPAGVSGDHWYRMERSERYDSLVYWLTDTNMIKSDSIVAELRYLKTDTTDNLSMTTDTVSFILKNTYKKKMEREKKLKEKEEKEKLKEWQREKKEIEKKRKKEAARRKKEQKELERFAGTDSLRTTQPPSDSIATDTLAIDSIKPEKPKLGFAISTSGTIDVFAPVKFTCNEPMDSILQHGFHLYIEKDSLWNEIKIDTVRLEHEYNPLAYMLLHDWQPGGSYKITVDSCSVKGIYGLWNERMEQSFRIKEQEEYANLFFNITNACDSAFVELLDGSDKVVRTAIVINGSADLLNINPGEYYARIVIDSNRNGEWDTGNFDAQLQPEEVYYFPKVLKLKKNWDVEQSWNIFETPVDKQKPEAVKKNKPEKKKSWDEDDKEKKRKDADDDEEDDFMNPQIYTGNKYTDFNRQR